MAKGAKDLTKKKIKAIPNFWELDREYESGFKYIHKGGAMSSVKIEKKSRYKPNAISEDKNESGIIIIVEHYGDTKRLGDRPFNPYNSFTQANKDARKIMQEINECENSSLKRIKSKIIGHKHF